MHVFCMHAWFCQGHLGRNALAIGMAVSKIGMRPSQDMIEQAVFQFMSLCLPKTKEVCSAQVLHRASCMQCLHDHDQLAEFMHV